MNQFNIEAERARMSRYWDEVQDRAKLKKRIPIRPFSPIEMLMEGWVPPNIGVDTKEVAYTPGVLEIFNADQIKALLAHEVGHIRLRHKREEPKQEEFDADLYSVKLGYGEGQLSALKWFTANHPVQPGDPGANNRHPTGAARIAAVEAALAESSEHLNSRRQKKAA